MMKLVVLLISIFSVVDAFSINIRSIGEDYYIEMTKSKKEGFVDLRLCGFSSQFKCEESLISGQSYNFDKLLSTIVRVEVEGIDYKSITGQAVFAGGLLSSGLSPFSAIKEELKTRKYMLPNRFFRIFLKIAGVSALATGGVLTGIEVHDAKEASHKLKDLKIDDYSSVYLENSTVLDLLEALDEEN